MSEDDGVARYQRPPRKGQFRPGQSGNPRGRPKNSKNLKTYVAELLHAPITVVEDGKEKKIPRVKAIAIQLVNLAAKGDPKGLAAVINLTREFEVGLSDATPAALDRFEDASVLDGIIARIRAGEEAPLVEDALAAAADPEGSSAPAQNPDDAGKPR